MKNLGFCTCCMTVFFAFHVNAQVIKDKSTAYVDHVVTNCSAKLTDKIYNAQLFKNYSIVLKKLTLLLDSGKIYQISVKKNQLNTKRYGALYNFTAWTYVRNTHLVAVLEIMYTNCLENQKSLHCKTDVEETDLGTGRVQPKSNSRYIQDITIPPSKPEMRFEFSKCPDEQSDDCDVCDWAYPHDINSTVTRLEGEKFQIICKDEWMEHEIPELYTYVMSWFVLDGQGEFTSIGEQQLYDNTLVTYATKDYDMCEPLVQFIGTTNYTPKILSHVVSRTITIKCVGNLTINGKTTSNYHTTSICIMAKDDSSNSHPRLSVANTNTVLVAIGCISSGCIVGIFAFVIYRRLKPNHFGRMVRKIRSKASGKLPIIVTTSPSEVRNQRDANSSQSYLLRMGVRSPSVDSSEEAIKEISTLNLGNTLESPKGRSLSESSLVTMKILSKHFSPLPECV